jgi:hypothetical protein
MQPPSQERRVCDTAHASSLSKGVLRRTPLNPRSLA